MNLLHLPLSKNKGTYNSIVEIPKDTNAKYEYNVDLGVLELSRCLISSMRYPANYGFIPQTLSSDGDPLDVLIYNSVSLQSLSLVEIRPIGALHTIDNGVDDYKILGIPVYNPNKYENINDVDSVFLEVCSDFFRHYKNNDVKKNQVIVKNWIDRESSLNIINKCHNAYIDNTALI